MELLFLTEASKDATSGNLVYSANILCDRRARVDGKKI